METKTASSDNATKLVGVLAEFGSPEAVTAAARKMRDAGYTRWDVHSPFPIHGIDEAMAIRVTKLPYLVMAAAAAGASVALLLQWFTNGVDYPFLISGKPAFAIQPSLPVTFELTVLFGSFAAFLGMLGMNGLPRWSNPLLKSVRFLRSSADRFFITVEAADRKFSLQGTTQLLQSLGASLVEPAYHNPAEDKLPKWVGRAGLIVGSLALIPPAAIVTARLSTGDQPRIHIIQDMDFQAKFKPQTTTALFSDGRAMRPPVPGTMARGSYVSSEYSRGLGSGGALMSVDGSAAGGGVPADGAAAGGAAAGGGAPAAGGANERDLMPWVKTFPAEFAVNEAMMKRGQERYTIYCSVCHGLGGDGDGLVSLRAQELQASTWVKPVSLHADYVMRQPVGQLFDTVSHGVRKMPGYAAAIPVQDRWAIVLYVKALQKSRNGTLDEVPEDQAGKLKGD